MASLLQGPDCTTQDLEATLRCVRTTDAVAVAIPSLLALSDACAGNIIKMRLQA